MHQNGQGNEHVNCLCRELGVLAYPRMLWIDVSHFIIMQIHLVSAITFCCPVLALDSLNKQRPWSSHRQSYFYVHFLMGLKDKSSNLAYKHQQGSTTSSMLFIFLRILPRVLEIHFEEKKLSNQVDFQRRRQQKK